MKLTPIILMLALAACTNGDSPIGTSGFSGTGIIPLKLGNSWQYFATQYDASGSEIWSFPYHLQILEDTLLDYESCYFITGRTLVVNRDDGLWGFDLGKPDQYLVLKYPVSRGYTYSTGAQREYSITVRSTDTTVTVAAGTYSCYEYVARHVEGAEIHAYVAPQKGIVLAESYNPRQSGGTYLASRAVLMAMHLE